MESENAEEAAESKISACSSHDASKSQIYIDMAALSSNAIRDFLPYKTALRLKDGINFSLMVEGEAPSLNLSKDEILQISRL